MSIDQGSRAIGGQCQVGAGVYPAIGVGVTYTTFFFLQNILCYFYF